MKLVTRFAIMLLLIGGFCSLTVETSQAQCAYGVGGPYGGYGGYYGGLGFGYWGLGPYASGRVPTPPYFALHPPVYYSQPVARTYGYSPFAYPGTVPTPEVAEEPVPFTMVNPYVPSATEEGDEPETVDEYAVKPLVIENPFVIDNGLEIDATELVSIEFVE